MKFIKITLSLVAGLVFLLLVAAAIFIVTFDANDYRQQVSEQVERHTGRAFAIEKIQPSVFPWVGIELKGVELGNAAGFSKPQMLKIERLDVKVELLPLIRQQIHIDTLRLHGLRVSLGKDSNGRTNWDDILRKAQAGKPAEVAEAAPSKQPAEADTPSESPLAALLVNGIEIRDAQIQWQDLQSGQQASLSQFNLTSGAFQLGQPLPLSMDTRVKLNQPDIETALSLEAELNFDPGVQQLDIPGLQLDIKANGEVIPGGELAALIKTVAHIDMKQQQVTVKALTVNTLGLALSSQLNVKDYQTAPKVDGQASLADFDANRVMNQLGISLPQMQNPEALKKLALSFDVKATDQSAELNNFKLKLDHSNVDGRLAINSFSQQAVEFDLRLDTIHLDDYMPPVVEEAAVTGTEQAGKPLPPGHKVIPDAPIELPLELIRSLDVKGQFRAGHIEARSYELLNLIVQTQVKAGVANISKLQAELLEGQLNAVVQLDARGNTPVYNATFSANGVKADSVVTPVLQDLLGETEVSLSGAANLDLNMTSRGNSVKQLSENSNGKLSLNVGEARLNGVDAEYFVRKAVAGYLESKNQGSEWVKGQYLPKQTTALQVARANAVIKKGIVSNNDLLLQASRYKISGAGKINIPDEQIDYRVVVDLQPASTKTTAEKLLDVPAPINVKGSFAQPQIGLDKKVWIKGLSNALTAEARAQAKAAAEQKKQELQRQIELKKQQEREALKKKADEKKQQLEQKAKDKLLDLFR